MHKVYARQFAVGCVIFSLQDLHSQEHGAQVHGAINKQVHGALVQGAPVHGAQVHGVNNGELAFTGAWCSSTQCQ